MEMLINYLCGMKRKAHGAQQPKHINRIAATASAAQRSDSPAQAINQGFILQKILLLIAMLNITANTSAADGENLYKTFEISIGSALSKYFTLEVIFFMIAGTLLLVIAAVFYETHRSKKIKQELHALAMAKFDFHAEKLNLRLSSAAILKKIIQKSRLQDPSSILQFSHVFENSLEKYYEKEKIASISKDILAQISVLRKALGFSSLPRGIALSSTRQFCGGDECTIQIPENETQITSGTCQVLDSDELQWSVSRPDGMQVQDGTWVSMSFTRQGDAEYTFRTQVLRDLGDELVLSHTNELTRTQQRNWLRVNVNISVKATIMEESRIGDILSGRIADVSGGGMGIVLPTQLPNNSMLLLNFELPRQGSIVDLLVKVVRVAGLSAENPSKIMHSVAFAGGNNLPHEKIIQFVFEKQREDILFMRSYEDAD